MHVLALAEVCVVVAGSVEREAGSSGVLRAVSFSCQASKQLTNSRLPLLSLAPFFLSPFLYLLSVAFTVRFILSLYFPSYLFSPAAAILGKALEQEIESGSVGQLRQQAQAGCALAET